MYVVYEVYRKDNPSHNYIGKTSKKRIDEGYMGSGDAIKQAINKYGKNSFEVKILYENISEYKTYNKEKEIIEEISPYYNISKGGRGVFSGRKHTEETKIKMSLAHKNNTNATGWQKKITDDKMKERRKKVREKMCGRQHTEETKQKMSAAANKYKKPCVIDGVYYESIKEAARKLNKSKATIKLWSVDGKSVSSYECDKCNYKTDNKQSYAAHRSHCNKKHKVVNVYSR